MIDILREGAHEVREYFQELYKEDTWDQIQAAISRDSQRAFYNEQVLNVCSRLVFKNLEPNLPVLGSLAIADEMHQDLRQMLRS